MFKKFALILLIASTPAVASSQFSYQVGVSDIWVTDNLMHLADQAEQDRIDTFIRKLDCWSDEDDFKNAVTCQDHGKKLEYVDEPKADFTENVPVLIMVPIEL